MVVSKTKIGKRESVVVEVTLTNAGKVDGEEVAQLYVTHEKRGEDAPLFALKGFQRVSLAAGASTRLRFVLGQEQFSMVDKAGHSAVPGGKVRISVAGSLPTQRSGELGAARCVETELEILGK
jgi:beta-glucosidase